MKKKKKGKLIIEDNLAKLNCKLFINELSLLCQLAHWAANDFDSSNAFAQ